MDTKEDFFLTEEAAEWIAQKKSEYLSELVGQIAGDDFGFEEFHLFDHLIPQTISGPDRAFDDKSDTWVIRVMVRSYQNQFTFHHIVVGALIPEKQGSEVLVPIISFVTKRAEVVKAWSRGEPLARPTLS